MIKTSTDWEDSGFDCDHCGGEILKRTDHETGRADFISYQCAKCGCQWAEGGDVLRIGHGAYCRSAQRRRMQQQQETITPPELPDKKYYLFGRGGARALAEELGVPLLGEIPIEQSVREGGDEGVPAVLRDENSASARAFAEMTQRTAQELSIRNAQEVEIPLNIVYE